MTGTKKNLMGSFNRLDRGDRYVDHHVFFCLRHKKTGLNHVSFEVQDIDDVCIGHDHLVQHGYEHMWGIGRHVLGSQVYDYWSDPWGRIHEHRAAACLNCSIAVGTSTPVRMTTSPSIASSAVGPNAVQHQRAVVIPRGAPESTTAPLESHKAGAYNFTSLTSGVVG